MKPLQFQVRQHFHQRPKRTVIFICLDMDLGLEPETSGFETAKFKFDEWSSGMKLLKIQVCLIEWSVGEILM
jgi:hypothetical protein